MRFLSAIWAEAAHRRRGWYARHPDARRHLYRPVISVGNLTVGGTGKTPLVRHLAGLLVRAGERPAILSRGYGRTSVHEGATVVSDGRGVTASLAYAGDEPLMLARTLPGALVIVGADRFVAGRLAETRLGCTCHILDDGFQHVRLERDLDLVVVTGDEVDRPTVLPSGRLRERIGEAARADAMILAHPTADPDLLARRLGVARAFRMTWSLGAARTLGEERPIRLQPGMRVLAVAGIARPERFTRELQTSGLSVAASLNFRDHHRFSRTDVDEIARQARALGVDAVVTTEKDAVRLEPFSPLPIAIAWVPLVIAVEPAEAFESWIVERLADARQAHASDRRRMPHLA